MERRPQRRTARVIIELAARHGSRYTVHARMVHILLIEDTEAVRGLFRAILEQAGYVVREASTGSEGIRHFHENPSDVVITDMYMPNGDGFDVIGALRREDPAPKIIVMSGQSSKGEILSAAKLMGADLILAKPVPMDELLNAVETVLGQVQARRPSIGE